MSLKIKGHSNIFHIFASNVNFFLTCVFTVLAMSALILLLSDNLFMFPVFTSLSVFTILLSVFTNLLSKFTSLSSVFIILFVFTYLLSVFTCLFLKGLSCGEHELLLLLRDLLLTA